MERQIGDKLTKDERQAILEHDEKVWEHFEAGTKEGRQQICPSAKKSLVTVELFCGTKSFSKVAAEHGHRTFTVDNDPQHNPDLCIDIMQMSLQDIPEQFRHPDVVWASVPCTYFSKAHQWVNWEKVGKNSTTPNRRRPGKPVSWCSTR